MTTEQTGRQDIDSTDSQARIEPTTLVASPPGGDPTPLPRRRAAHGTRTGMRAAPPPIPDGTRPKLAAAPPRASSKSLPPPIPSKPAIEIAAHADGMMAAASKPASPLPDPDGWSLPATLPLEPSGPSYPSVYHPEPAAPDVTVLTGFESAPIEAEPSAEWLAKIKSVLTDEAPAPAEDSGRIAAAHAHAVAATAARDKADVIARSEAEALARAEAEIAEKAIARAARKASESDADGDTDRSADAEAEAIALAKANAAANASLPKLPTARPSNAKLPPPRGASGTRPPVPAVAAAAAAMFTTKADPTATSQLELVDLEPVETPAKAVAVAPQALPVVAQPAPAPAPAKPVNPLVAAAQASMDVDIDWDVREPGDMTSAHTTDFEMPVKSKMPQRAALGLFVAATFATVGYLATRSTSTPKHATPAPAPVAETAPTQVAAPTPAPTAAAPAEVPAPATQAVAAPVAPAADQPKLVQLPVSSTPSGALVTFVDGEKAEIVGRTPTTITLDASKPHDIALTMVGHETQLEHVPVGGMTALAVTLPAKAGASTPAETPRAAAPAPAERTESVTAMVPAHSETAPAHHAKAVSHPAPPVEHITTPAPRATPAAPSGSGILMISSKPPCEIVVDGKSTHLQTPQKAIPLSPGTHTVMLVNAGLKIHKTVAVDIVAKKPTKVIQDFTKH